MNIKNIIRDYSPSVIHEFLISMFNKYQRVIRYGGKYSEFKTFYKDSFTWSREELDNYSKSELEKLLNYAVKNSTYYAEVLPVNCSNIDLVDIPFLSKDNLRSSLNKLKTVSDKQGVVNYTGGTTGTSTKNVFTQEDVQKRNAFLDAFREKHGYLLGLETAWFSGKELLSRNDINNGKFFKRDFFGRINYYSTFHINDGNITAYVSALNKQQPKFLVGFPSSIVEIALLAQQLKLELNFKVKVSFPTAEKVTLEHRRIIETFYGGKVIDQYASSEGAPFILECENGHYHLQLQTGVFELFGEGVITKELIVTSFGTYGTPLIRYQIGDTVELTDVQCNCGDENPLVKEIGGRIDDYLLAYDGTKINLGNLSNSTKNVEGIIQFQIIQYEMKSVQVAVCAAQSFTEVEQDKFLNNLRYRLGYDCDITLKIVNSIPVEKSGKFRIVKNYIRKTN